MRRGEVGMRGGGVTGVRGNGGVLAGVRAGARPRHEDISPFNVHNPDTVLILFAIAMEVSR